MTSPTTLIIPVENQVRELDAKLLLSCVAVERGFDVIIGSRAYVHFQAASIPRGVYLAKSMRNLSRPMFLILRKLGHHIVAWDEEALVHTPPDTYFTLRLSPHTIKHVAHLFAWGEDSHDLLHQYPHLPKDLPVHITGNPRGDMLRADMRAYFDADVATLRDRYGDFILVNTNFSDVNPFIPNIGLFKPATDARKPPKFGQAGLGMSREFAEGLRDHKQAIMNGFLQMIPALAETFPDLTIVVRPHPSEKQAIYDELATKNAQIHVTHEGNIIPWLLSTRALVHNGCTTGIEAYALNVPAATYLTPLNRYYDYDFQGLPNLLSHECFNLESLHATLRQILDGDLGIPATDNQQQLFEHHLTAQTGPLAAERIVEVLENDGYRAGQPPATSVSNRAQGWFFYQVTGNPGSGQHAPSGPKSAHLPRSTLPSVVSRGHRRES